MDAVGVICEYNPFHLGHARHLEEAKHASGAGAAVCVMSGGAVQRGEFPMLSETARAEAAVRCGADLVLALPLPWALSSAEHFALGGISILAGLGVISSISFGSECGDEKRLARVAALLCEETFQSRVREQLSDGMSYAAARHRAARRILGADADCLCNPNDTLGVEYIRAASAIGWEPKLFPILRLDAHDGEGVSAKQIRELVFEGRETASLLPLPSETILRREIASGRAITDPDAASDLILARLRQMTDREYESLPDSGEGLWMRLARYGRSEPSLESVLEKTKTKRYAYARLRRMVLCAFLGVHDGDADCQVPYTRVLAFNDKGRLILREAAKRGTIPVVTRTAEARRSRTEFAHLLEAENRAADLRALALPAGEARRGGTFWRQSPIYVKDEKR